MISNMITFDTMKRNKIMVTIAIIFLALIFSIFYLSGIRDHSIFYASQTLFSGDKIKIKYDDNCRKYWYSFPERHPIINIGGGDLRNDIYFVYKGQNYHFRTYSRLVLINNFNEKLYIITEGSEGTFRIDQMDFRFYRFDGNWKKIKPEEFPKPIAIPNITFICNYPELEEPDVIDPEMIHSRCNITAYLWLKLEKGIYYYKEWVKAPKPYVIDKNLLIEYKKKYIDPYWNEKKLNENVPVIVVAR